MRRTRAAAAGVSPWAATGRQPDVCWHRVSCLDTFHHPPHLSVSPAGFSDGGPSGRCPIGPAAATSHSPHEASCKGPHPRRRRAGAADGVRLLADAGVRVHHAGRQPVRHPEPPRDRRRDGEQRAVACDPRARIPLSPPVAAHVHGRLHDLWTQPDGVSRGKPAHPHRQRAAAVSVPPPGRRRALAAGPGRGAVRDPSAPRRIGRLGQRAERRAEHLLRAARVHRLRLFRSAARSISGAAARDGYGERRAASRCLHVSGGQRAVPRQSAGEADADHLSISAAAPGCVASAPLEPLA